MQSSTDLQFRHINTLGLMKYVWELPPTLRAKRQFCKQFHNRPGKEFKAFAPQAMFQITLRLQSPMLRPTTPEPLPPQSSL